MEVALQQKGGQNDDSIFSRGFSVLVLGCRDPYGTFVAPFRDSLTHTCWDVLMDLKQCLKLEIVEKTALSHTFEM